MILLSDILGLSLLVESIDHPKPDHATEGTVLGPFHTHDAEKLPNGELLSHDEKGEPLLVICTVKDSEGKPIPDVRIDIWETDSSGNYDVEYKDRAEPDGRAVMYSDSDGSFWFQAIKPVSYPIPSDGPVGKLLKALNRHPYRPAHIHFMLDKPGWDHVISALYMREDPYITSDAVFGVKKSLIVDYGIADERIAEKYRVSVGMATIHWDFVLVSKTEGDELRESNSRIALQELGRNVTFVNGLPVPDVD